MVCVQPPSCWSLRCSQHRKGSAVIEAYIEFVVEGGADYRGLNDSELREIGEFTRENILKWCPTLVVDSISGESVVIKDLHAVCGGIDIPWATEEAKHVYKRIMEAERVRKEAALAQIREMNRSVK